MSNETWALYNSIDGAVTYEAWENLRPELEQFGYQETYDWTIRLFPALIYMATKGFKTDPEAIAAAKVKAQEEREIIMQELEEMCGFPLNPNSPKQCQQYFYGHLGHKPYTNQTGGITTDDKAMARLFRKGVKEAKLVQRARALRKLESSYLDVSMDSDMRLRCFWKPRGTYGGRLSSSKTIFQTGLNLQNLDPAFKPFIVADDGYVLVEMDKAKAEWVVTAYACGDPHMINAIESGSDVHAVTGQMISGVPMELIEKENKILKHASDPDTIFQTRMEEIPEIFDYEQSGFLPRSMTIRQAGKKSNHALNYLETYRMFSVHNEIPEAESKAIVKGYRDGYSMLPIYWDQVETKMLQNHRVLENCFGRKIRFLEDWSHDLKKKAVAWMSQSPVANLVNMGLIQIYESNEPHMLPLSLNAQVHDSIVFQYPVGDWIMMAKAIKECDRLLTPQMKIDGREFTIDTDCAIGLNWGAEGADNPRGMRGVDLTASIVDLAKELQEKYAEMR